MQQKLNIFLIAGRTGGPFFPLPTVAKNLRNSTPIYIGVKGGFEEIALADSGDKLEFLPDIRLTLLTFKKEKISETIANYFKFFITLIKFLGALFKSIYLVLKYRPRLIFTTGSFLAIPIILAIRITNFLGLTKSKIAVHQQDPEPGLSNKFAVKFSQITTCVFQYTKQNFPTFNQAEVIPNPIDFESYNFKKSDQFSLPELNNFINSKSKESKAKPILLIFGGGSGSEDINVWTVKNANQLLENFRLIHLTGILQKKKLDKIHNPNYLRLEAITIDMKLLLATVDVVLCRAGLGSITELMLLNKPAFIVPLPATHQEKNAELVSQYFYVLDQKDRPTWIKQIRSKYPDFFKKIKYPDFVQTQNKLEKFYLDLNLQLDN